LRCGLLWGLSSEQIIQFISFLFFSFIKSGLGLFSGVSSSLAALVLRCSSLLSARERSRCQVTIQSQ
jgi:hypothetical protein